MTPAVDMTRRSAAGPSRTRRPVYVDLLPPCNHACPAGENIQAWLALAQAGKYREAWDALVGDNPMPAVHGRVCYHPCESSCNRGALDASVSIHAVERFLGDLAAQAELGVPQSRRSRAASGFWSSAPGRAGCRPAIISRAWATRSRSTRRDRCAGGMMHFGIPAYRLPRPELMREIARIEAMGVEIVLNHKVEDVLAEKAAGDFDAVFIAIGAGLGKHVDIPARDAARVLDAVSLSAQRLEPASRRASGAASSSTAAETRRWMRRAPRSVWAPRRR